MTGTGQASCFDITTSTMDVPDASCKHVAVSSPATCPYDTLVVDPRDYENERADDARGSLLDLLDDWGLERAEGDDVVVTSRTYSVYDAEYPGFDGENMEGGALVPLPKTYLSTRARRRARRAPARTLSPCRPSSTKIYSHRLGMVDINRQKVSWRATPPSRNHSEYDELRVLYIPQAHCLKRRPWIA